MHRHLGRGVAASLFLRSPVKLHDVTDEASDEAATRPRAPDGDIEGDDGAGLGQLGGVGLVSGAHLPLPNLSRYSARARSAVADAP